MVSRISLAVVTVTLALFSGCRNEQAVRTATAHTACARVVSLCQGNDHDRDECERSFASFNPTTDAENIARTARCVGEAHNCGEASGCMAGGVARAGAGFLRDFTNGLTR